MNTALINQIQRKARGIVHTALFGDRRCQFRDLANIKPQQRVSCSPIIQFYSSVDNIGNYLPVLGIQKMLSHTPDTWCIHDKQIDFDFVNKHYKYAIIGGAGLLHQSFDTFWARFARECKLPTVIWGVGVCLPDESGVRTDLPDSVARSGVNSQIVAEVAQRCELINVRDDLTANYYNFKTAHISACPTVVHMADYQKFLDLNSRTVLYSSHEELVASSDRCKLKAIISRSFKSFKFTDNIQRPYIGLNDLITNYYCRSNLVVTTRLHGAIIAYGLSIPYVAIMRDEKLRAFHRIYGNGISVQSVDELGFLLKQIEPSKINMKPIELKPVLDFGEKVKDLVASELL